MPSSTVSSSSLHSINLSMLDGLVKHFLSYYGVTDPLFTSPDNQQSSSSSSSSPSSELEFQASRIREQALHSDIPTAIATAQQEVPSIMQYVDSTSEAMELHLQHAVELLRSGDDRQSVEQGLDYLHTHTHLHPSAAWDPSLYRQFKDRLSTALLEGSSLETTDRDEGRHRAACVLIDAMHRAYHNRDQRQSSQTNVSPAQASPELAMLLRYLVTVHNLHHVFAGTETLCPDIDHFLLPGRLPSSSVLPSPPSPSASSPSASVNNNLVRQLTDVLSIPRDEAVATLQQCSGDPATALRTELIRMQLNTAHVLPLALAYARHRGFIAPEHHSSASPSPSVHPPSILSQVRDHLAHGRYGACLRIIDATYPKIWESAPGLQFRLRALVMAEASRDGNTDYALQIAEQDLWRQASKEGEQKLLRDVSVVLLDPSTTLPMDETDLAGQICTFINTQEGGEDHTTDIPTLQRCLQHLLYTHTEWFRRQRCADPFQDILDIPVLKNDVHEDGYGHTTTARSGEDGIRGDDDDDDDDDDDGVGGDEDGDRGMETRDRDDNDDDDEEGSTNISEDSISMLLEIVPVSRPEAVMLLEQHDGDLQQVLESLFS